MDDATTDLRNTRGRLIKLGLAALVGGVLTFFTVMAMMSSGRGANNDPIGVSIMPLLGLAIFVVTTSFAHKFISKLKR